MKILYVGTLPPHPGGSAFSATQILDGLARAGHEIRALAPMPVGSSAGSWFRDFETSLGVVRYPVAAADALCEYRAIDIRNEARSMREALPRVLHGFAPEVVFAGRESYAWHVPDIARVLSVPYALRIAGGLTAAYFDGRYPASGWRTLVRRMRKAARVFVPAQHLADAMRRLRIGPVETILNAVNLHQFSPGAGDPGLAARLGLDPGQRVVTMVANQKPCKRPMDLVDAARLALARDPRLVFVMVGDGPLRGSLERACRERGLQSRFRFTGWVDYGEIPDYIRLSDMVVLPSEAEGLARVYLEAQACARVLVAASIAPAREVVTNGDTGLLFPTGDARALAERILLAAGDAALRAGIGARARERVLAHGVEAAVARYEAGLGALVASRSRQVSVVSAA